MQNDLLDRIAANIHSDLTSDDRSANLRAIVRGLRAAVEAERAGCMEDLNGLASMARAMGDTAGWRALVSAADALKIRD